MEIVIKPGSPVVVDFDTFGEGWFQTSSCSIHLNEEDIQRWKKGEVIKQERPNGSIYLVFY
jgi:hypothetical protein